MLVTYGKPLNFSISAVYTISFKECVQKCWRDTTCVLVYDTAPTCKMFALENLGSVRKLNSSSNSRIAFRTFSTSDSCSNISQTPILTGATVTGRTYYNISNVLPTYQEFTVKLDTKTNIWSFKPSFHYPCAPPFMPVKRTNGVYCFGVRTRNIFRKRILIVVQVIQTYSCLNKSQALAQFSIMNGYSMMVIANMGEYNWLLGTAMSYLSTQNMNTTYSKLGFWMDGVRKASCKYPAVRSPSCNGTNEFDYSDPSAPNPVFNWIPGQPDALLNSPRNSDCLYLQVSNNGENGVDDIPCSMTVHSEENMCMNGYIYGTPAVAN
ncbi:hypothetical protein CRE_18790 [Caenorhabditis remanei]|uniref:PAN-3 domain-containing protein n=1 Tax=Caenorhabditis remanei TaxID=31234 RepID=E3LKC0_CAERE|nr:hypothetical protein CRE_18790 [Caenorhabditis remanei]